MTTPELEEAYEAAEVARHRTEEKRRLKKIGVDPEELVGAKLESAKLEFKQFFEQLLVLGKNILEVVHQQELQKTRSKLIEQVGDVVATAKNLDDAIQDIRLFLKNQTTSIADLNRKYSAFFDKMDKQMQSEREMLMKLNDYLDNWL